MKFMYITRGEYFGKFLDLDDDTAASAIADGWGVDASEMPSPTPRPMPDLEDNPEPPQSMLDWQASIAGGGTDDGGGGDGGALTITALRPNSAVVGAGDVTMTVDGTGFTKDSVIVFNGGEEATTFISDTMLSTLVEPSTATEAVTVPVAVKRGLQTSNELPFTFTAA